jgi:hypothetical protein
MRRPHYIQVTLGPDERGEIERFARAHGRSLSAEMRYALRCYCLALREEVARIEAGDGPSLLGALHRLEKEAVEEGAV